MRRGSMVLWALLGSGCGGEPGVSRTEHEALLQRVDAMSVRIDALERELRAALEPSPARGDVLPLPRTQELRLPRAEPGDDEAPTLQITVTATGLELDGTALTRDEARTRLADVARREPKTRLVVMAGPEVPHQEMVEVLELAREAGLVEIAIAARVHGEDEGAPAPE